ncbi:hypothetical protein BBJ28_00007258 [Nothophytophthora sp. Chile5]|nr:hypothetical protein BBJ28_00007258 [Nothophytophthora sp. Chile5]
MAADEAWEEWEEGGGAPLIAPAPSGRHDQQEDTASDLVVPTADGGDCSTWKWDMAELEREMRALPSSCVPLVSDPANGGEAALLAAAPGLAHDLHVSGDRLRTLQALAQVTRLHLLTARASFAALSGAESETLETQAVITEKLREAAGEWGEREHLRMTLAPSERQQLEELTSVLHQALHDESDGLTLFQDVLEQLFAGLPDQKLTLPAAWVENAASARSVASETSEESAKTLPLYLQQLLAISNKDTRSDSHVPRLTEAQIFQDAKDIARDELQINGERVEGTRGYDAVVDALQHELEHVLAQQVGKSPEQTPMAVSNALQAVAMAVLHASNRTESGGSAYELLGKFLSNHEMDRVLLRPASARAAPLEVHMDVGPYLELPTGSEEPIWAFGLRVKLVAETWYLVCDAEDPSTELYEFATSFCNRLAFPVGLTPFHPLDSMRKDRGAVVVRLALPSPEDGDQQQHDEEGRQ